MNLKWCSNCALKVKEKLQKINGVYYIYIDTKNGLVLVSGFADPSTIQNTIGKKAELLAYEKDFMQAEKKLNQFLRNKKKDKTCSCSCDSDSDSGSGSGSDDEVDDKRKPIKDKKQLQKWPSDTNYIRNPDYRQSFADPRVYGGYREPLPWYGRPYYFRTPYPHGYPGINYPASYIMPSMPQEPPLPSFPLPRPPQPQPQPQMPLSNVYAIYSGQTEPPVGNSLYHSFSDDNIRACNIL